MFRQDGKFFKLTFPKLQKHFIWIGFDFTQSAFDGNLPNIDSGYKYILRAMDCLKSACSEFMRMVKGPIGHMSVE